MTSWAPSKCLLAIVLLHFTSACSLVFMSKAPEPVVAPTYPVDCTSSNVAPVLDSICGGYFFANGILLAAARTCDRAAPGQSCVDSSARPAGIALSVGLAALCTASAVSGVRSASRCSEVKASNALCITGDEAACLRLNPAWSPPLKFPGNRQERAAPMEPPATPATAPAMAPAWVGCSKDVDCKGDRVCDGGLCKDPPGTSGPAPAK